MDNAGKVVVVCFVGILSLWIIANLMALSARSRMASKEQRISDLSVWGCGLEMIKIPLFIILYLFALIIVGD